jgi:hypothetical protein
VLPHDSTSVTHQHVHVSMRSTQHAHACVRSRAVGFTLKFRFALVVSADGVGAVGL